MGGVAQVGRPAKPTALRVLHGDQASRIPRGEPVPDTGPVQPPASLDAQALAVWQQLAPDLERKGVLTPWDAPLFGVFCQSVAYAHQAEVMVNQTAILLRGRNHKDAAVKNPAMQVFRDMADLALRSGGRFGLTPSDRAGLATGEQGGLPGEHLLTR
jgi:P27 family predicted phage terminase small subunit